MPLTQTQPGRWHLDFDTGDWSVVGKVARNPGKLTLQLTGGHVTTRTGTQQLVPTTVDLDVYPDESSQ